MLRICCTVYTDELTVFSSLHQVYSIMTLTINIWDEMDEKQNKMKKAVVTTTENDEEQARKIDKIENVIIPHH